MHGSLAEHLASEEAYGEREAVCDFQSLARIQAKELPSDQCWEALLAMLHDLQDHMRIKLHDSQGLIFRLLLSHRSKAERRGHLDALSLDLQAWTGY